MRWPFWKAILILPGFALVYAPAVILWLTRNTSWSAQIVSNKPAVLLLSLALLAAGALLMFQTMRLFHDASRTGTIAPWRPIETFIVTGPYRHVRNPMLVGVNLVLAGEALLFQSAPLLLWLIFFISLNTVYFVRHEEPGLERRYGDTYTRYKREVPRWIPQLTAYDDPVQNPMVDGRGPNQ